MCHYVHKTMNNMGQTPAEQWVPPWSQIKVYDGKESVGMEYTMLESYFDSMYPMKSDDIGSKQSFNDKITPDPLHCDVAPPSKEKTGFEAEVAVTPPVDNITLPSQKAQESAEISNEKSSENEIQRSQEVSFTTSLAECVIKEEPVTIVDDLQCRNPGLSSVGWGNHPSSMHFDSLKVVSEHLVERIKLEDSVFRDVFQSGASFPMCAASTPTTSSYSNPWGITPQCNLNNYSSYVNNTTVFQGANNDSPDKSKTFTVGSKEQNTSFIQATNNFNRNMNNNFMCTTMFLMNDSLQQNSAHTSHNNSKKHHDIFNIACEKGCNCEATNPLFRTGSGQMFGTDKHPAAGKHFMAPCGPLQLTAQECSEFLLKKVAVSNSLIGSDGSHVGTQNNSEFLLKKVAVSNSLIGSDGSHVGAHNNINTNNTQQKNRQAGTNLDNTQQTNSSTSEKLSNTGTNTGQKYRVAKERPFSCQECGKSFLLKHHLVTHARVHTGERPHVCPECGKSFAHKHCLSTHLLLHSSQRPYQCPECKKSFTLKHHLVTHARVHSRDRPFVCRECGRTFPQKRHLATHAKFHSGERPHVCEECGESFSREDHLVIHSRFHGGLHPYVCPDCGSTFARKFELVNHGRLHGRIPHSCDVCGKEFLQKRTLLAHARLHVEGERPFVCQHCGETFQRKNELVEHSHVHADDKSFVCRDQLLAGPTSE
ncbi:zinc finger protein 510-like isoform X2 [Periplaneta americana]|uniref:zinc finger protein 510-like isoform X2 n=1 Tax=Periplaneta americana TaxID=6978 RepID=UPI0037E849C1